MWTCEEAGSQLLPHLEGGMCSRTYSKVRDKQPPQKLQESAETPVQEDSQLAEDILTERCATEHASSNGNQTDLQNVCIETMADVGDTAVVEKEHSEMCDTGFHQGNTDEYDVELIPGESYMVATDMWEYLPNEICRLCASTDEHPKQSIVGWLHMLNEVIPDLVAVSDGLPQYVCRPCTNKLYTCNKIKADFIEAHKKLEECFGFKKSPGIQFRHLASVMSGYQMVNELTEADLVPEVEQSVSQVVKPLVSDTEVHLVSQVEEHLMTEVEEQLLPEHEEELVSGVEEQSVSQVVKPSVSDAEVRLVCQVVKPSVPDAEAHLVSHVEEHLMTEAEEQLMPEGNEELVSEVEEQSVSQVVKPLVSDVEVQLVSQVEEQLVTDGEQLVFEVPSDIVCAVLKSSNRSLLKGKEMVINSIDKLSINIKESVNLRTDNGANLHGSFTQCKSEPAGNTSKEEEVGHKKYKYVCGECEQMFTEKGSLTRHKRTHFRMVFQCDYCKKQYTSIRHLNDHRRLHTKELPFMCEFCGRCFRTKEYLNKHKFVHKPPSYTCPVCNKKCSSSFYLAHHKKVHSSDTKLICEVCGKMIYTPFTMKLHMRTHTGEKPFHCASCGKCFISAAKLREHRLLHTDRKFRCLTCGKGYYFKASLRRHQRCHKLNEYRCPICFTLFASSENMRKHGKVYCKHPICAICGQTLLTNEMVEEQQKMEDENEEVAAAERCRSRQYFKCCPVCSQTIHGRGNMVKHMKECHKDYGYKPFACERCVKMFSAVYVLGDDVEYDIVNSD